MTTLPLRTRRFCSRLQILTWLCMSLLTAICLYWMFHPDTLNLLAHSTLKKTPPQATRISGLVWAVLALGVMIKAIAWLFPLYFVARLFGVYARQDALSEQAAAHVRWIGTGLIFQAGVVFLTMPYLSLALSIDAPVGQRSISVGVTSVEVITALLGCLILMIGHATGKAVEVARENREFV